MQQRPVKEVRTTHNMTIWRLMLFSLLFAGISPKHTYAQNQSRWEVRLTQALQAHDKRLFDAPDSDWLLMQQPERFGTWQTGLNVLYRLAEHNQWNVAGGIGLAFKKASFKRPFDHFYDNEGEDILALLFTDNYQKYLIQSPLEINYVGKSKMGVSLQVLAQFDYFTRAKSGERTYTWTKVQLYSFELNPGIFYQSGPFRFALNYRLAQMKRIDKILFNRLLVDTRTDKHETFNPMKFFLSLGVRW